MSKNLLLIHTLKSFLSAACITPTRPWLLALGVLVLLPGCAAPVANYDYYKSLSPSEIETQIDSQASGDTITLTLPLITDFPEWGGKALAQTQKLRAIYQPGAYRVELLLDVGFGYQQKIAEVAEPPQFDRARVNGGYLLVLEQSPTTKNCDKKYCRFEQQLTLPISVPELLANRYTGLRIETLEPGKPGMGFRVPDTYVRALYQRLGAEFESHYLDWERVVDAAAKPNEESGRDQLQVEALARAWGCSRTSVQLQAVEGPKATFQMECNNDDFRIVECQWGRCALPGGSED
ncbi:hypothetical protein [Halioxenophilus sp. WMMB6]|uniref:hypothetical protein n=1 Tax=Halioxenophilus sp. WMMB6 TaxID=3073815 RepID=UPI00295EDFC7|nr:hypothetical protein [Halioxenophilus sp. WMMB6]